MAALGITVLKNNVPWGPFTRTQIDEGLARGDFTVKFPAHSPGLKEWRPLGEVLDYVDRDAGPPMPLLPPVPAPRELPRVPGTGALGGPLAPPIPVPAIMTAPIPAPRPQPVVPPPPLAPALEKQKVKPEITPEEKAAAEPEIKAEVKAGSGPRPAPFIPRAIAFLIDCAILFVPVIILYALGAIAIEISGAWEHIDHESRMEQWALLNRNVRQLALLVASGFGWLYGAGLECSRWQATVGKRWMGIKVVGIHGERISFLRATGRYVAKYLSALPCFLGFIAALFSSRGAALHDRLAETWVVRG
jgi:uncharacterized RDD family membrane protein YckC